MGQDGFDSYHEPAAWGMDLLKVGKTLGLGSIGRYLGDSLYRFQAVDSVVCAISSNGLYASEITTTYNGWQTESDKTTLTSVISIQGRSALTGHTIGFTKPISGFCTGLAINDGEAFLDKQVGEYRLLATFGQFSLANDRMGLAVVMKSESIDQVLDGAGSHVVVFKPGKEVTYYFMAAWEQDYSGVTSMEAFEELLDAELIRLNSPLQVAVQ